MNDSVTPVGLVRSALVVDTLSVSDLCRPHQVIYEPLLADLSLGFKLDCLVAHAPYFEPRFGGLLSHLGFQLVVRKHGYVFDLVKQTLELFKYYPAVLLFGDNGYIGYLKEEAMKHGSALYHIGEDIQLDPERHFRQ